MDPDSDYAHESEIRCLDITGDSYYLFSADKKGYLKQWVIEDLMLKCDYGMVSTSQIYSIVCTPNGQSVFVSNETGYVAQFSVGSMCIDKPYVRLHQGEIISMACSADSNYLFTSDSKGNLFIWRFDAHPESIEPAISLSSCHVGPVTDFAFLNSSSLLATSGHTTSIANICIWDTLLSQSSANIKCEG